MDIIESNQHDQKKYLNVVPVEGYTIDQIIKLLNDGDAMLSYGAYKGDNKHEDFEWKHAKVCLKQSQGYVDTSKVIATTSGVEGFNTGVQYRKAVRV